MNTPLTSTITSRSDSTAHTITRGLILFFVLTLGWMGYVAGWQSWSRLD